MSSQSSPLPEIPAIGFLAEVSQEHRAFLTSFGKFLRPKNGDTFIEEGRDQDSLSLILSGTVHVVSSSGNRPLLLASLGAGDSIGDINIFDPAKASASVIARSECMIWSISRGELDTLSEADPTAAISVMKGLLRQAARRTRQMIGKLAASEQKAMFHEFWQTGTP